MRTIYFVVAMMTYGHVAAQSFSFQGFAPFGLQELNAKDSNSTIRLLFFDLDQDGDLDVLHTGMSYIDDVDYPTEENIHWFVEKQMNVGTNKIPAFIARESYTNTFPFPKGYFMPVAGDLNKDNRLDLIVCAEVDSIGNQQILYYRNTGTSLNPQYAISKAIDMDLEEFVPGSLFIPELTDLDRDGDLDLMVSGYEREYVLTPEDTIYSEVFTFKYAKNIGPPNEPKYLGWFTQPYNMENNDIGLVLLAAGDIDLDGDMDLLGRGEDDQELPVLFYYENSPTPNGKPSYLFPLASPFGLPSSGPDDFIGWPTLIDIDADTDLDLFIFRVDADQNSTLEYYKNELASDLAEPKETDLVAIFPQPVIDELIISNRTGQVILEVNIMDITGHLIRRIYDPERSVNVADLGQGTYLIQLQFEATTIQQYFIKMDE